MADVVFVHAKAAFQRGEISLTSDDIRVKILSVGNTAEANDIAEHLDEITSLLEYDGAGYSELTLSTFTPTVTANTTTKQAIFSSGALIFVGISAGSLQGKGILFYKRVDGTLANDIPILYKEPIAWPFIGNGEDITVNPHATDGWSYM